MDTLAERLRFARLLTDGSNKRLSSRELDRLAGLCDGHTSLIERGVKPRIELKTAIGLAEVLGLSLDWLALGKGAAPAKDAVIAAVTAARKKARIRAAA